MNKRISLGAAIAILLVVAAVVFSMTWTYSQNKFDDLMRDINEKGNMYDKLADIDRVVRDKYYDTIISTRLMDSMAEGYMAGLGDEYSRYISAAEYSRRLQNEGNESVGIGAVIEVSADDFYLVVTEVYDDSPAQVAGMEPGDLIVAIDDVELTRENSSQMLESVVGPQGTRITLLTRRGGEELPLIDITRRVVTIPTVDSHMMEQSGSDEPLVGYIRIREFGERTYDQFNREYQRLKDSGARALVIDVRDNQGGTLRSAARILDKLLPGGVLVNAVYKDGSTEALYTSDANEENIPMAVLVNEGTSGEAEIFAQAVRDYDKGWIVGVQTAGKGILLETIPLGDGSAIEVAVAVLQTRSGIDIHKVGVRPDYEVRMDASDWSVLDDEFDAVRTRGKEVVTGILRSQETVQEGESGASSAGDSSEAQGALESSGEELPEEEPSEEEVPGEESQSDGDDAESGEDGDDGSGEDEEDEEE